MTCCRGKSAEVTDRSRNSKVVKQYWALESARDELSSTHQALQIVLPSVNILAVRLRTDLNLVPECSGILTWSSDMRKERVRFHSGGDAEGAGSDGGDPSAGVSAETVDREAENLRSVLCLAKTAEGHAIVLLRIAKLIDLIDTSYTISAVLEDGASLLAFGLGFSLQQSSDYQLRDTKGHTKTIVGALICSLYLVNCDMWWLNHAGSNFSDGRALVSGSSPERELIAKSHVPEELEAPQFSGGVKNSAFAASN